MADDEISASEAHELLGGDPASGRPFLAQTRRYLKALDALTMERNELAAVIDLLRPVVEYVSRGRSFVDVGPYPDAAARAALGALDDATALLPPAPTDGSTTTAQEDPK